MSKDLNVEGMTRGDFEQMFGDVKESFSAEISKVDVKVDKLDAKIDDVHLDLRKQIERIDTRTDEDTTLALSKIAVLEGELVQLKRRIQHA